MDYLKKHHYKDRLVFFYADNDPDDLSYFKDALEEVYKDAIVQTHGNGEELMDALKNPPPVPYLVFLDLNMPVKNGFEVLEDVSRSETLKNYPIVVFSTSDDPKVIQQCREMGAVKYVIKPNSYPGLKKSIEQVLNSDLTDQIMGDDSFLIRF